MPIIASKGAGSAGGFGQRNASWPIEYPFGIEYLVVAGGSGAGGYNSGGGGAGGYRNSYASETSGANSATETPLTITEKQTMTITVGAGDTATTNGEDSVISSSGITDVTSLGGGYSGTYLAGAGSGGSGGGCCDTSRGGAIGTGTAGQGMNGATGHTGNSATSGGGGGGASAAGTSGSHPTGGNGGNGLSSEIDTVSTARAGGGGGFGGGSNPGGSGGGGNQGQDGTVNTGGGGAGGGTTSGGSGVVILRLPDASYSGETTGSPTVITGQGAGSDETIITFTGDGTYEA